MARLPIVGSDLGTWGTVLNEFLEISHASDGRLFVTNTGAANVPLTVRGSASQTASLLVVEDSGGTDVLTVNRSGGLLISDSSSTSDSLNRVNVSYTMLGPPAADQQNVLKVTGTGKGTGTVSERLHGVLSHVKDHASSGNKTITGAANNGSGLIRITATAHGYATGDRIAVAAVGGTTEANGAWTVTVITADTFDLQGSTFTNTYTSGGTATNRPMMYSYMARVTVNTARGGLTGTAASADDVVGYAVQNDGTARATDAFYVADSPTVTGAAYVTAFAAGADVSQAGFKYGGDLTGSLADGAAIFHAGEATASGGGFAMLVPNNRSFGARNNANNAYVEMFKFTTGDKLAFLTALFLTDNVNIQFGTTTGTKIGSGATEKMGFYGATPIVRPAGVAVTAGGIHAALVSLGLIAA